MAIEDAVKFYCNAGRLHRLPALIGSPRRFVCVSDNIRRLLEGPWADDPLKKVGRHVYASLLALVEEERVAVRVGPPKKGDAAQLASLGVRVWEFRCLGSPERMSVRVFGCIAAPDMFVGLDWKMRYELRGGRARWKQVVDQCETTWTNLFPFEAPMLVGRAPNEYVSGAYPA